MLAAVQHQKQGTRFLKRFVDGHIVSPLLLMGPEGVGKRFSVQSASREAFCSGDRIDGCVCPSCRAILKGAHPDYFVLSASEDSDIGVDEIRKFVEATQSYPTIAKVRCFVLDGADRLTVPAADAFLKNLEEPPAFVRFFLLAEERDRVLPTIRSRCGSVHYGPLPEEFVLSVVQQYEPDAAKALVYARMGEGSVGSAVRFWGSGKIALRDQIVRILTLSAKKDFASTFSAVDALGKDLPLALKFLQQLIHDVLIVRVDPMRVIHTDRSDDLKSMVEGAPLSAWSSLARKLKALQVQYRKANVNLAFHVKTLLIESF